MIGRRNILMWSVAAGIAPFVTRGVALAAQSQEQETPPGEDRIRAAAQENRRRLTFNGGRFSGDGYDWLLGRGREARFFCLGEEHGIAENAKLAAQLFSDLVPSGYTRAAVEISPPMAAEIDAVLRNGGFEALERFLQVPGQAVAFFGMREEAEWLAAARRAVGGRDAVIWGTDYEPFADRHLIALLARSRKPAAAEAALSRLVRASSDAWARYDTSKDLRHAFGFAGDPALVRAVRAAWPSPDPRAASALAALEATLEINQLWVAGRGHASNVRRAADLRENFLRYWRPHALSDDAPKVFLKYGSNHLLRGLTPVGTFDTGSLVAELASLRAERSFHLLVLPGAGSATAVFDPTSFTYRANAPKDGYAAGLERVTAEAFEDAPTLFVTEPLRPLVASRRNQANPELVRAVMGYDAILVLSGSTASTNL